MLFQRSMERKTRFELRQRLQKTKVGRTAVGEDRHSSDHNRNAGQEAAQHCSIVDDQHLGSDLTALKCRTILYLLPTKDRNGKSCCSLDQISSHRSISKQTPGSKGGDRPVVVDCLFEICKLQSQTSLVNVLQSNVLSRPANALIELTIGRYCSSLGSTF